MPTNQEWLQGIVPLVQGFKDKTVLDVGSDGEGDLIQQLSRTFHAREAVGLSLKSEPKVFSDGCRIDQGDIRATSYPDASFDVIVSSAVFEHVHGLGEALEEI